MIIIKNYWRMKTIKLLVLVTVAFGLFSCVKYKEVKLNSIDKTEFSYLGDGKVKMDFEFNVDNPNPKFMVKSASAQIFVDSTLLGNFIIDEPFFIDNGSREIVATSGVLDTEGNVWRVIRSLVALKKGTDRFSVSGQVVFKRGVFRKKFVFKNYSLKQFADIISLNMDFPFRMTDARSDNCVECYN